MAVCIVFYSYQYASRLTAEDKALAHELLSRWTKAARKVRQNDRSRVAEITAAARDDGSPDAPPT